jgi:cytochrome b6-f complex iron-sulfur subunit
MLWLVIAIVAVLVLAVLVVLFTSAQRRSAVGSLSRETRSRDTAVKPATAGTDLELAGEGRARADESRGTVAARGQSAVAEWQPVDEEELAVSRRQFMNRALLTMVGIGGLVPFGGAVLAFIWPFAAGGFGGKVVVGSLTDIFAKIDADKKPFYSSEARTYLVRYPTEAIPDAQSAGYDAIVIAGMEKGIAALYQKCVHLGCRVPFCESAQWFECPCHGSKYNRVGEKRDGPAPRGLDHWPMEFSGDTVTVNTGGQAIQGIQIGVDTTKQKPEGAHCV